MRRQVISTRFERWVDPAACFAALFAEGELAFWLDSGVHSASGMSCMGIGSASVIERDGRLHHWPSQERSTGSILEFLRREQASGITRDQNRTPFPLGWIGWLGYELHEATLGTDIRRESRYPDAAFLRADRAIVFDHGQRTVSLVALGDSWSGELREWLTRTTATLETLSPADRSPRTAEAVRPREKPSPVWAYSDTEYLNMIADCQEAIRAGDAYQLCLTTEVRCDIRPEPVETYLRLRELSPSHHGGFLRIGGVSLLSASPEKFLTVTARGEVESRPIKGTRRRGATPDEDESLIQELRASGKEQAENIMIVDLVRNDFSRVCELGTVAAHQILAVETYAQVHQLVSTVRGTLEPGRDAVDAVVACFPAGSMTGTPKLSAVRILDGLERRPRGIYSGAWGYFGWDGSVDLAMTIRSIVLDSGGATIGTGGGITALSVPSEELEETRIKATALLRALGLVAL